MPSLFLIIQPNPVFEFATSIVASTLHLKLPIIGFFYFSMPRWLLEAAPAFLLASISAVENSTSRLAFLWLAELPAVPTRACLAKSVCFYDSRDTI
ncbi:hypothetical protein LguiA_034743 [Lonicera macranthoides]